MSQSMPEQSTYKKMKLSPKFDVVLENIARYSRLAVKVAVTARQVHFSRRQKEYTICWFVTLCSWRPQSLVDF